MAQAYNDPAREHDPFALPDIEVFELTAAEAAELDEDMLYHYMKQPRYQMAAMSTKTRRYMIEDMIKTESIRGGWYWQACFPGCLPDGEPVGPFDTYDEALADAQDWDTDTL